MSLPRLAILCAGQGAQHPAMFDLARRDAHAAALLDAWLPPSMAPRAEGVEGADSAAGALFLNRHAQPALVAAACATWIALRDLLPPPLAVAGYSVGEVAALAVSGVLDAADAVALARQRAALMDACVDPAQPQGLLAVSGLRLPDLHALLQRMAAHDTQLAIVNGVDQCILGGRVHDAAAAAAAGPGLTSLIAPLEEAGAQASLLPVAIASHTSWMQPALAPLSAWLDGLNPQPPQARLLAGVDGSVSASGAAALSALLKQTVETVRWDACMDALAEAGITVALELGPGNALSRMLTARHPGIACRSAADFRSVEGIVAWVLRR